MSNNRLLLVGDNPFHGISHLSQEKAIERGKNLLDPNYGAMLVNTALENGADGFMFSSSNTTLSILKQISDGRKSSSIQIYAIVPYVFEFVRMAVTEGGVPGLTKKIGQEVVLSGNMRSIFQGVKGVLRVDPPSLLKAYLLYEESRIRKASGKVGVLDSIFLHEVITDMGIGLNMEWLFRTHIDFMMQRGIKPGIHTHNLPIMVRKFREWGIEFRNLTITTQFNAIGFGMCPSWEEVEAALRTIPEAEIIAYGVLASGYLKIPDAAEYIKRLSRIKGIVVGISKEYQAKETFKELKATLLT
jgi:hypothetical protein